MDLLRDNGTIGKDASPPFSVPDPPSSPACGDVRGRVAATTANDG